MLEPIINKNSTVKHSNEQNRNLMNELNFLFEEETFPPEKYIIKGDTKVLNEISTEYIKKIISKSIGKSLNKETIMTSSYNNITTRQSSKDKNRSCHPKSNRVRGDNNINKIIEEEEDDINNSIDSLDMKSNDVRVQRSKKNNGFMTKEESEEFLFDLYNQGVASNPFVHHNQVALTKKQKEKFKLEETNPYLYSFSEIHPFSMFYGTKYSELISNKKGIRTLKLPAPRLINNDDWRIVPDYTFDGLFKGIFFDNKLGLVISDEVVRKKFSGLVKDIIIQILKVPFGHHISLNVKIFEPKTVLDRYTGVFSFANRLLIPASDPKMSTYDRFKSVITLLVSGMYIPTNQLKPFNPFVGETYQAELPNGAKLYVENVTHTPLVERFLLIYKDIYEIDGYWALSVNASGFGSKMSICQQGPVYVRFPKIDECIMGHLPEIKVVNATSEKSRALRYTGNQVFVDIKNGYKAVVLYDYKKDDVFEVKGNTMKYTYSPDYVYSYKGEWEYGSNYKMELKEPSSEYEIIEPINGSWIGGLYIGNDFVWDIHKHVPEYFRPVKNCIPSDGRFREDLIWLYRSFFSAKNEEEEEIYRDISMEWKEMMEGFSRWERKARKEGRKNFEKKAH